MQDSFPVNTRTTSLVGANAPQLYFVSGDEAHGKKTQTVIHEPEPSTQAVPKPKPETHAPPVLRGAPNSPLEYVSFGLQTDPFSSFIVPMKIHLDENEEVIVNIVCSVSQFTKIICVKYKILSFSRNLSYFSFFEF